MASFNLRPAFKEVYCILKYLLRDTFVTQYKKLSKIVLKVFISFVELYF